MVFAAERTGGSEPLDPVRELLKDDDGALAYLTERWVAEAMLALRRARRRAGLTQTQIADRLETRQPAIARLEGDHSGGVSLRRYAEYLAACGALPLEVELAATDRLREYFLHDPAAPRTGAAFKGWLASRLDVEMPPEGNASGRAEASRAEMPATRTVDQVSSQRSLLSFQSARMRTTNAASRQSIRGAVSTPDDSRPASPNHVANTVLGSNEGLQQPAVSTLGVVNRAAMIAA